MIILDHFDRIRNRHEISIRSEYGHRCRDILVHGSVPADERRVIVAEHQRRLDDMERGDLEKKPSKT